MPRLPAANGAPASPGLGARAPEPSCPVPREGEGECDLEVHLCATSPPPPGGPLSAHLLGPAPHCPPAWGPQQG